MTVGEYEELLAVLDLLTAQPILGDGLLTNWFLGAERLKNLLEKENPYVEHD